MFTVLSMDHVNILISDHLHFMGVPKNLWFFLFTGKCMSCMDMPTQEMFLFYYQGKISSFSISSHVEEQVCMFM